VFAWIVLVAPPVSGWSRHYEYVQAIQFCFFSILIPALFVTGAPWHHLGLASKEPHLIDDDGNSLSTTRAKFLDRVAVGRTRRLGNGRAVGYVFAFVGLAIFWRVAPVVDYVTRHAWMLAPESLSLVIVGTALWFDLVESPPVKPGATRPYRIGMSTISMWVVWVLAYLDAMSHDSWYNAFQHVAGHGVSLSADQQLTAAVMWMLSAGAFLPVVFWNLVHWLQSEEEPTEELNRMVRQDKALRFFGGN
jgi:cytochrome c oxidase assembly factor CtaG